MHPWVVRSKAESLKQLKKLGMRANTVIDIGACAGTLDLCDAFPESKHVLIEPIEENAPVLKKLCDGLKDAEFHIAAISNVSENNRLLQVKKDLTFSTLNPDGNPAWLDHELRSVPAYSLDDLCRKHGYEGPFVVKVDVDGRDLEVIQGGVQTLAQTECLILECALFNPQVQPLMQTAWDLGFALYDMVEPNYRPLDGALFYLDLVYVKEDSIFRKDKLSNCSEAPGTERTSRERQIADTLKFLKQKGNNGL